MSFDILQIMLFWIEEDFVISKKPSDLSTPVVAGDVLISGLQTECYNNMAFYRVSQYWEFSSK